MASSWSALQIELLETGANSGTWGTATNVNLGDAVLGEAITGSATVNFPSAADVTLTLTNSATTQAARNLRLNITESGAGIGYAGNLILGSNCQIEKFYLIRNNGTGVKTIKNTSGTGVAVAAGKATLVYNDGTNVVDVLNSFSSAILGAENAGSIIPFYFANQAAFPSASTYHGAIAHSHADGAMYFAHAGSWVRMLNDSGPLGTPSSGTATNLTGLPLSTGVTGTLPIANGGTGTTSTTFTNLTTNVTGTLPIANGGTGTTSTTFTNLTTNVTGTLPVGNGGTGITSFGSGVATFLGTPSSANLAAALTDETGSGSAVFATSPTLVTPALGTVASGNVGACTVDGTNLVGYRAIPRSGAAKTGSYTLAVGDVGEFIQLDTGGSVVVPDATFATGDAVVIYNNTASSITLTMSITTAYLAGTATDRATLTLAPVGIANILFISGTICVVTGNVT